MTEPYFAKPENYREVKPRTVEHPRPIAVGPKTATREQARRTPTTTARPAPIQEFMPQGPPNSERLQTVATLCQTLEVSEAHLRRLLREGRIPGVKAGAIWLARPSTVEAY